MILTGCGTTAHPLATAPTYHSQALSPATSASPSTTPSSRPVSASSSPTSSTASNASPTTPSHGSATSPAAGTTSQASPTTSSQPSPSVSSSTSTSMTLSAIAYTINQQATIFQLGHKVGFPAAYVPRQGFNSKFLRATTFTAATSHKSVLMLTYNNFTVQESENADSFGTGGDQATTGSVELTLLGSGLRTPVMGTWTTDYGIQGSGTHGFLNTHPACPLNEDRPENT